MRGTTVVLRIHVLVVGYFLLLTGTTSIAGDTRPAKTAIEKADRFLNTPKTGEYVLGFVHLGATYRGHTLKEIRRVVDGDGEAVPGEFALVYRFDWETSDAGETDVAFLCNRDGDVTQARVLRTNAVLQQPFAFADAAIQVVGAIVLDAFRDQLSEEDQRIVARLIQNSDSKGLLTVGLILRQAAGLQ